MFTSGADCVISTNKTLNVIQAPREVTLTYYGWLIPNSYTQIFLVTLTCVFLGSKWLTGIVSSDWYSLSHALN